MKLSFNKWLQSQRGTNTPIADLAFDATYDMGFPKRGNLQTYLKHLKHIHACNGAINALTEAWGQWNEAKQK